MCFDDFDYDKIAAYDEQKIRSIMLTENMIRVGTERFAQLSTTRYSIGRS